MEAWTTEPGVQLYTSPLNGTRADNEYPFFCLETQHFPDSPNHPQFPSTILEPNDEYRSTTIYRFLVD
jgi:aldose 1-epimerase